MAAEGSVGSLIVGGLVGAALLAAIAIAMLRFSQRLPIGKFFGYSSALVAVLAVVLAGKGVAALQEAGLISIYPLSAIPRISMLGLFPNSSGHRRAGRDVPDIARRIRVGSQASATIPA